MSLGANLLSIFVPSYFLTVTKVNNTSITIAEADIEPWQTTDQGNLDAELE